MRTILSLLLAAIIFVVFGGLAFFLVSISTGAKFERKGPVIQQPATR